MVAFKSCFLLLVDDVLDNSAALISFTRSLYARDQATVCQPYGEEGMGTDRREAGQMNVCRTYETGRHNCNDSDLVAA